MKELLFITIDNALKIDSTASACVCIDAIDTVAPMLAEYYGQLKVPDYRLSKLLTNFRYYIKCWANNSEYTRDWSKRLIAALGITLKKTAEYDFNIRYFPEKVNERHREQFALYERINKQEKSALEENLELPYDVTIFMVTYNQLELTKLCLESVYQNTNDICREIFLIDNGSSDGTYEYFKNDNRIKIIRLIENVTLLPALQIFYESRLDTGKFWLYMNNDVIVTPHWVSLMLDCIKSDSRIAMAVPVTNRTDPGLSINPPFGLYDIDSITEFGERFNHEASVWKECMVVWPYVGLFRPSFKRMLGHYEDYLYYQFYYADGDFLYAGKKCGYKFMQCPNIYVHHFDGGSSVSKNRRKMLDLGEKQFFGKYGFFPSDSLFLIEYNKVLDYKRPINKVLFLGLSRGNFIGEIQYYLNRMNIGDIQYYCADTLEKLKMENIWEFVEFEMIDSWYDIDKVFQNVEFDRIIFAGNLASLRNPLRFLSAVFSRLAINGVLLFLHEQNSSFEAMEYIFCTSRSSGRDACRLRKNTMLDINSLCEIIKESGLSILSIDRKMTKILKEERIDAYKRLFVSKADKTALEINIKCVSYLFSVHKEMVIDDDHTMEEILYQKRLEMTNGS